MACRTPFFPFVGLCTLGVLLISCASPSSPVSRAQDVPDLGNDMIDRVTISEEALHSFVSPDTLEVIAQDLTEYFAATNEGRWDDLMHHFPMHKKQGDTTFVRSSKEALEHWTERGVKNRTASAEIVYASLAFTDGNQDVVLLNMQLSHFVEFHPQYDGPRPDGLKGMVESNYGKGNAVYKEAPLAPGDSLPLRYWEVSGLNRIWAVSHVDSAHWCFLPPNFNESGAAGMMGANAMVEALRHRRANDPTAER